MKAKKHHIKGTAPGVGKRAMVAEPPRRVLWPYFLGGFLSLVAAFWVYGPSLSGPFIWDDRYLPFGVSNFPVDNMMAWVHGVRPVLMWTYWVNYRLSAFQPYSYHAFNVVFHAMNSVLLFFIVRKILEFADVDDARRNVLAVFAGGLFLLHPVNTEAVSYVAQRAEDLSVLLFFSAFAIFLCRRAPEMTWARSAAVLALFGLAVMTKEHTIALPALLLLTDYFWNPPFSFGGIRRNWRLYGPVVAGVILVGGYLAKVMRGAGGAGFGLKDFTWYQYFFTQCRAFWVYIRLFLLPVDLRVDYDFPISYTILDHGSLAGLAAILAVVGAAFYFRRRYPLAAYGLFAFVILMAPTSSFLPIKDPIAERRLYLSMIGLLFIVLEFLRRADIKQTKWMAAMAGVLLIAAFGTYQRSIMWSDPALLWEDTVAKSPTLARDEFQLAEAYREEGQCVKALRHYERTAQLDAAGKHSDWYDTLFLDWGLAYGDCLNQPEEALAKYKQAAVIKPTAIAYSQIGRIYGKQGRNAEALEVLEKALKLDRNFDPTYVYLGGVHQNMGDLVTAAADFKRALSINPQNEAAAQSLASLEAALAHRH
jgi:tetratricopeptide (TPR) repeat protein